MTLNNLTPADFRNALIAVGAGCMLAGYLTRRTGATGRGLGMALIVVGVMMVLAAAAFTASGL